MPYADKEKQRQYANGRRRAERLERGLQKCGRKELTPEQKILSKENRKLWEKQYSKEYGELNLEQKLMWASKRRAKNKGLEHTIKKEHIIVPSHCPYLGIELQLKNRDKGSCRDAWPTLDRIDNNKGYTPENIEVISFKANTMKNNATPAELLSFTKRVLSCLS